MKTSGVVIDFYDDLNGSLVKKAFPTAEALPEGVKTAHILSQEERDVLRDEAYALILHNEGSLLRKFACVDEGNTILSCLYFEENAELLPQEAMKTAAANLASFCEDFGLEPTPFVKMAAELKKDEEAKSGMGRTRDPMRQPMVGDEADWSARTNLVSVRGGSDSGRVIPTANQMKTAQMMPGMPGGTMPAPSTTPAAASPMMGKKPVGGGTAPMPMPKVASGGKTLRAKEPKVNLDSFHKLNPEADPRRGALTTDKRDVGVSQVNPPQQNHTPHKDQNTFSVGPGQGDLEVNYKQTMWPKVANRIDVSGKDPEVYVQKKTASIYALGNKYPLDSYVDVQAAVSYFDNNWTDMSPVDRHEYCVKTASRANDLGIEISELMDRYGSQSYSADVEAHLSARKANSEKEFHELFDTLKEKRSSIQPDVFVGLLQQADEAAGLNWYYGGSIADPFLSTFGPSVEKLAGVAWSWQSRVGDHVNCEQLDKLAKDGHGVLKKYFTHDLIAGFMKDPVTVFESLPEDSKTILARLANGEFDGLPTN